MLNERATSDVKAPSVNEGMKAAKTKLREATLAEKGRIARLIDGKSPVEDSSLAHSPVADFVTILANLINEPFTPEALEKHRLMQEAYAKRQVKDDSEPIHAPFQYEDQLHSLNVRLEAARLGSIYDTVEGVQAEIDHLQTSYRSAQDWKARNEARRLVEDERADALAKALDAFGDAIRKRNDEIEKLADEFQTMANVLIACSEAAKNAVYYDLFETNKYREVARNSETKDFVKQFEQLIRSDVQQIISDWQSAYFFLVRRR